MKSPKPENTVILANFTESKYDIDMVYVEGGTFMMGATSEHGKESYSNEKPVHRVTLSSFYIGKYPVTQAQWKAVMGDNPSGFIGDDLPVDKVSWYDAQGFIGKLNAATGKVYRLPTEAEWEFAARGGNKSKGYKYSGSDCCCSVAWSDFYRDGETYPVGKKRPNELNIYDMSGNVDEWCSDWYGDYSSNAQTDPQGALSGSDRATRGGNWYDNERYARVSSRSYKNPADYYSTLGFRLACSSQ